MTPNDTTILNPGQDNVQTATLNAQHQTDSRPLGKWQTVTIGGVAGIAMGAAASQAINAMTADTDDTTDATTTATDTTDDNASTTTAEVHQASVGQSLSFGEAFQAARAEIGPGGVFLWHGQLYNTYTAEEWNAMSDAAKDEFAAGVQPLLGQQVETPQHVGTHTTGTPTHHTGGGAQQVTITEDDTPEVHFLGVQAQDMHGQTMNVGRMTVNDVAVALVDVDDDQVFDISIIDNNRNGKIEDNEVTDISDQHLMVEDFQLLSELEQASGSSLPLEQANNTQNDLAPEMPDYMNDADVNLA
ncbi:MAG: hypothetical protein IJS59_04425 [Bacteroidaceae bacterium]|nr:hypothetical protein [Bacteroidaceae bacterium]